MIQKITVLDVDTGCREIFASVSDGIAVHNTIMGRIEPSRQALWNKYRPRWTVTHAESGFAFDHVYTATVARRMQRFLIELGAGKLSADELRKLKKPVVKAIARAKVAHE